MIIRQTCQNGSRDAYKAINYAAPFTETENRAR